MTTPTPREQSAGEVPALEPFTIALEGWSADPHDVRNWPNTITVSAVTGYDPDQAADPTFAADPDDVDSPGYADTAGYRELIEIDNNYKATRPGQHPVRLTRVDAIHLAANVLTATEDTFHYARLGQLRANDAAEVLQALNHLDVALAELRDHALTDLMRDTGLE